LREDPIGKMLNSRLAVGEFRELIEQHYVWIYNSEILRPCRHQAAPGKAAGEYAARPSYNMLKRVNLRLVCA
jgi:hypothetical protein